MTDYDALRNEIRERYLLMEIRDTEELAKELAEEAKDNPEMLATLAKMAADNVALRDDLRYPWEKQDALEEYYYLRAKAKPTGEEKARIEAIREEWLQRDNHGIARDRLLLDFLDKYIAETSERRGELRLTDDMASELQDLWENA